MIHKYTIFPLLLLLCSCMPKYTIVLKNIDYTHYAMDKTDFDAQMWVTCKWIRSITITDITYQLYVKDNKFGEGQYPGKIKLGRHADTLLNFPCTVKHQDIALPLAGALFKGDFDYEVRMSLKVKACIFSKRVTTSYKGTKKIW